MLETKQVSLQTVKTMHSSYKHVFLIRVEVSVDPDQMALSEASSSGFTMFLKGGKISVQLAWVKVCSQVTGFVKCFLSIKMFFIEI